MYVYRYILLMMTINFLLFFHLDVYRGQCMFHSFFFSSFSLRPSCLTVYTNLRIIWHQLRKCLKEHTWFLCAHKIALGGSGRYLTMHVKLMVEPMSIYKSGPPRIVVTGSVHKRKWVHFSSMHRHWHWHRQWQRHQQQQQQTEKN